MIITPKKFAEDLWDCIDEFGDPDEAKVIARLEGRDQAIHLEEKNGLAEFVRAQANALYKIKGRVRPLTQREEIEQQIWVEIYNKYFGKTASAREMAEEEK